MTKEEIQVLIKEQIDKLELRANLSQPYSPSFDVDIDLGFYDESGDFTTISSCTVFIPDNEV